MLPLQLASCRGFAKLVSVGLCECVCVFGTSVVIRTCNAITTTWELTSAESGRDANAIAMEYACLLHAKGFRSI